MHIPAWIVVALTIVATARATRLVTADYLTRPIRNWVERRRGEDSHLAYWIGCDWCASIATGTVIATATVIWHDSAILHAALLALTASYVTGLLSQFERASIPVESFEEEEAA